MLAFSDVLGCCSVRRDVLSLDCDGNLNSLQTERNLDQLERMKEQRDVYKYRGLVQ